MGEGFLRDPDSGGVNAALNYGYAILRSACARALCAAGLLPMLGIHHHNAFNAFCLADDMMEPLRPFVDMLVFGLMEKDMDDLQLLPPQKKKLAAIQRMPLPFHGEEHTLSSVTSRMAQGLARSFAEGRTLLPLPG
jgi:CRISPR-associated protein Cas1